ncbi:MAG: TetR/AcrR family transcriptional regulator [Bacteroidales bacterium]|nr:TetR/AcrR family transcriptional regulator [Bacteroidales bacterium]
MSPRTPEQFEEIREAKRALILDTALELFANEGFFKTSISDITKKAGISKGLIYNYFESKEALIRTIAFNGIDNLLKNFDPNSDSILTKEELQYFIEQNFVILQKNVYFWKLYFGIIVQPQVLTLVEKELMRLFIPLYKMLENYFKSQGKKNPAAEARFFGAMIEGVYMNYVMDPKYFPIEDIKQKIIDLYIK